MPVAYLTKEQLLGIHRLVLATGEDESIRDHDMLDLAIETPNSSFFGTDLHESLQEKAAALMHEVIKLHPFIDGNKRTGYVAAETFLRMNGYEMQANTANALSVALKTSTCSIGVTIIANWIGSLLKPRQP